MVNKIQMYRDQFLMINQCKDSRVKNKQLADLMTEMEWEFNIPALKDETYNKANPTVMELYLEVSNGRVFL